MAKRKRCLLISTEKEVVAVREVHTDLEDSYIKWSHSQEIKNRIK